MEGRATEGGHGASFRFVFRVRYADTDQMGVAYYGNYLRWFEVGRAEMLRWLGMSYRDVERGGVRLPVVDVRCRYRRPARYDDLLAVETAVSRLGRASVRFEYRVVRVEDGDELARGMTEHCFLDPEGRPVRPPSFLVELLERAPRA
jgi:acyl-CoA thioester hydrolase